MRARLLRLPNGNEYLQQNPCTVSFEVRSKDGVSGTDSRNEFHGIWQESIAQVV